MSRTSMAHAWWRPHPKWFGALPMMLTVACLPDHAPVISAEPPMSLLFRLPLEDPQLMTLPIVGVDHDATTHDDFLSSVLCTNHDGQPFPYCYDGHRGTDFVLAGGFDAMDDGSVGVVAGADGTVVEVEDGHYDRCHIEGTEISCDGYPMISNQVVIAHADGTHTLYLHLMKDSIAVSVGDEVRCGDVLAFVGSSGVSSFPHLHFQVEAPDGTVIDPFSGVESQTTSFWVQQFSEFNLPSTQCADSE